MRLAYGSITRATSSLLAEYGHAPSLMQPDADF